VTPRTVVAGVVIETLPGAQARVASRLAGEPGIELAGGDGDRRIAAVWTGADGAELERLSDRLLAADPEVLGIFPTFVGEDGFPDPGGEDD
jgi:hypothetical protein